MLISGSLTGILLCIPGVILHYATDHDLQLCVPSKEVSDSLTFSSQSQTLSVKPSARMENARTGRITTFFVDRGYGFVVDSLTDRTFFFHVSSVDSSDLEAELNEEVTGQEVELRSQ